MFTNLIRTALAPTIENILNEERTRLNAVINEMENAIADMNSISAPDIADNISTYDIASEISIDAYDIAKNIEIDASDIEVDTRDLAESIAREISIDAEDITIDYSALGRHIVGNIDIDTSDIDIDYTTLARNIADNIDLNEVNARINNVHTNLQTVERKMDLLLNHHGIGAEDLLVYSNSNEENG